MTATYEAIATTTLGSAQSSVTFSSISGSFTDLVLISTPLTSTSDANLLIQFNSDTGNNYSQTSIEGNGSTASSFRRSNVANIRIGNYNNNGSTLTASIMNYSNTTTNKTVIARGGFAAGYVNAHIGLWRNTGAITSIVLSPDGGSFQANSTFTLYGIKAE